MRLDEPFLPKAGSEPQLDREKSEGFHRRFVKKKQTTHVVDRPAAHLRPHYLLFLERVGLIKLHKTAPTDHDRLFFFHEASPGIYMHFLGDLLFFQSVVTAMYLVLVCVADVHWGPFQTAMGLFGLCGPAINLFWLVPRVVGKTVMVTSIEHMKDKECIERVIFDTKKTQLLESLKILEIVRMEGKVERIVQEDAENSKADGIVSEVTIQKYREIYNQKLSLKKKQDIKNLFYLFDEDNSGSISKEEMLTVFASMHIGTGHNVTACANKLWSLVDSDGSGDVEWEEFCVLMAMVLFKDEENRAKDDEALFIKFDEDGGGTISISELASGFYSLGVELDADSIATLVGQVFKGSKQNLTKADFVFLMKSLEEMSEKAA